MDRMDEALNDIEDALNDEQQVNLSGLKLVLGILKAIEKTGVTEAHQQRIDALKARVEREILNETPAYIDRDPNEPIDISSLKIRR